MALDAGKIHIVARKAQVEPTSARQAKFVICDQAIDITYIRLRHGWLYVVVVLDWYARYVVRWAVADTLELPFVLDAVDRAVQVATPRIWTTDQGSQCTSPHTTGRFQAVGARISMDGKGRAHDTSFTERFWRTRTYEEV